MHPFAPSTECSVSVRPRRVASHGAAQRGAKAFAVQRVGHLVPAADFNGCIHSLFARACNIACGETLLTVVADGLADGPTTLKLAPRVAPDLRLFFRTGERLRCRNGVASTDGVELRLAGATVWRPAPARAAASSSQLTANLRSEHVALANRRRTHSSVIDREAIAIVGALGEATRSVHVEKASAQLDRLIGWGEGLTPAGDDFIVGWLAALDALAGGDAARIRFLRASSEAIAARASRTVPIAGHCLRLAAQGHFNADVTGLRNALLGGRDRAVIQAALQGALETGATSGADMVAGMIAGFEAWSGVGLDYARLRIPAGVRCEAFL